MNHYYYQAPGVYYMAPPGRYYDGHFQAPPGPGGYYMAPPGGYYDPVPGIP